LEEQECPETVRNIPYEKGGGCPEGFHSVDDDESGLCYDNDLGCEYEGLLMRPSNASCGEVEYVCRNYPDVEGCTVSVCAIYLLLALEWYNNFLKRITKLHIDNMETVYSKIMNQSNQVVDKFFP
jgi:hypothetical protein